MLVGGQDDNFPWGEDGAALTPCWSYTVWVVGLFLNVDNNWGEHDERCQQLAAQHCCRGRSTAFKSKEHGSKEEGFKEEVSKEEASKEESSKEEGLEKEEVENDH